MSSFTVLPKIDYKEFHFSGKRLLFDTKSCKPFYISPLISDLLRVSKNGEHNNRNELKDALFKKYNVSQIERATKTLISLVRHSSDSNKNKIDCRGIRRISLIVTSDCNLDCLYCLCSVSNFKRVTKYMNKNIARRAVDYLFENSGDYEQLEICFYGGEPLLSFPLIEYVVKYAQSKSKAYNKMIRFLISTNGTLLSKKIINFLGQHFSVISLSLDGDKDIQDRQRPYKNNHYSRSSHKKVTYYLPALLTSFKDRLYISAVQNPNNPQALSTYNYFKRLKIIHLNFAPCLFSLSPEFCTNRKNITKLLTEQRLLFREYMKDIKGKDIFYIENYWMIIREILFGPTRKFGCGAGSNYIAVSPLGDIFSCHRAVSEPMFKLGNLKRGIDRKKQNLYLNRLCNTFIKCRKCWVRNLCGGGCMWEKIHTNGKRENPSNHYCQLLKLLVTQSIRLTEELFADKIQHIN